MRFITLALFACTPSTTTYKGINIYNYMPLDGQRYWSYTDDESLGQEDTGSSSPRGIKVVKISEEQVDTTKLVTLEYKDNEQGEEGTALFRVTWSSDSADGILIHGYELIGEDAVLIEPALQVTVPQGYPNTSIDTSTNVGDFTSTFEGIEACPNHWVSENDDPWECAHINIEGPDGIPFLGDWWSANTWAVSIFNLTSGPLASEQNWVLTDTDWEP